jgi:opacity protein-like surface antigen
MMAADQKKPFRYYWQDQHLSAVATIIMKKLYLLMSILIGLLAAPLQAGTEVYKQVAPPPPPELYGLGFYGAIDMGANVYQNRGGDRTFTDDTIRDRFDPDFNDTLTVSPKNDVGFFGGIKLGYVFGTGVFRPTLEGDFFYNGFRGGADFILRDQFGNTLAQRDVTTWINTGAFMGNFIGRFAFGRFQPYAGAGVGIYYAESAGVEVVNPLTGRVPINTGGGRSHADLAWQIVAGSDYYWTPKFSTFIEYHFLNYTSTQIDTREDRDLRQHLVGAGVRVHF